MKILALAALAASLITLPAAPVAGQQSLTPQAQRDINLSRALINDKRNLTLADNMQFSDAETEAFWPLYREYREEMRQLADRQLAIIIDYADHIDDVTEDQAREWMDATLEIEKDELRVREKYIRKFRGILPETKVVRLMQIEKRMNAMIDLKIAEGVPLME
jgi:hypothetical protein